MRTLRNSRFELFFFFAIMSSLPIITEMIWGAIPQKEKQLL